MAVLVINERADAPLTEKTVARWLKSSNLPGIAVASTRVPGVPGFPPANRAQEADFVVVTPTGLTCIEVKGILYQIDGPFHCPVNSRWSMDGVDGDPVHVRQGDINPLDQATSVMYRLQACAQRALGTRRFVSVLVVLVPRSGTAVTLDKPPSNEMPPGTDFLLGGQPDDLHAWFRREARRTKRWTANDVHALLTELKVKVSDHAAPSAIDPGGADALALIAAQGFPLAGSGSSQGDSPSVSWGDGPVLDAAEGNAPSQQIRSVRDGEQYVHRGSAGLGSSTFRKGRPVRSAPAGGRRGGGPRQFRRRGSVSALLLVIGTLAVIGAGMWLLVLGPHPHHESPQVGRSTSVTIGPSAPNDNDVPACYPFQTTC